MNENLAIIRALVAKTIQSSVTKIIPKNDKHHKLPAFIFIILPSRKLRVP